MKNKLLIKTCMRLTNNTADGSVQSQAATTNFDTHASIAH